MVQKFHIRPRMSFLGLLVSLTGKRKTLVRPFLFIRDKFICILCGKVSNIVIVWIYFVFFLHHTISLFTYYRYSIISKKTKLFIYIITKQQYFLLNDITLFFYVKKRRKMFLLKNDYAIVVSWISIIYGYKEA